MQRPASIISLVLCTLVLASCNGLRAIGPSDYSGKPTVYAKVQRTPDPLLVGCYLRSLPSEYNRPNKYEFCLVRQGDDYAMFYYVMDGKTLNVFKGWTGAVITGDAVTADYDGSRYFVRDGKVWQMTPTGGPHRMLPMH